MARCLLIRAIFTLMLIHMHKTLGGCVADQTSAVNLWPDGIIPYIIPHDYNSIILYHHRGCDRLAGDAYSFMAPDPRTVIANIYEVQRSRLQVAMRRWERRTCIQFVPWSDRIKQQFRGVTRYVLFQKSDNCYSRVGLHDTQPQHIGLGDFCMKFGTILHELGHVIGMIHSIARHDRDHYVTIDYSKVSQQSQENFQKSFSGYNLYGTPYDYKSIMHYEQKAWSMNNDVVIKTIQTEYQFLIGESNVISFYDAIYVNRAYRCTDRCPAQRNIRCRNGGEIGGVDCRCLCQDGFVGQHCEIPLPGYQRIISWKCQRGWQFHEGKCVKTFPNIIVSWSSAQYFCQERRAQMVEFRDAMSTRWIGNLMSDDILLTTARSFWVGVTRQADETIYKWRDGTVYNDTLMPLHELGISEDAGCGVSDGTAITISSCDASPLNGIMCIKDFDPDCGGRIFVTPQVSSFVSPGYPRYYPSKVTCQYILQTVPGSRIEAAFRDFDLEYSSGCRLDAVEIQLTSDILQRGQRYCGAQLRNRTFISDGNKMFITFTTNERADGPGFRVQTRQIGSSQSRDAHRQQGVLEALWSSVTSDQDREDTQQPVGDSSFLTSIQNILRRLAISNMLN